MRPRLTALLLALGFVAAGLSAAAAATPEAAAPRETVLQCGHLLDTAAGVKIAFGTDAGVFPHGENARELALMVKAGMPPLFAIQAATTHAAELLRQQGKLGVVAPGAWADVIAVQGDPLQDITRLQHVSFVLKGGVTYEMDGRPVE